MPVLQAEGIVPAALQVAVAHTVVAAAHTAAVVVPAALQAVAVHTVVAVAVHTAVAVVPAVLQAAQLLTRIQDRIRLHRLTALRNSYKILPLRFPPP